MGVVGQDLGERGHGVRVVGVEAPGTVSHRPLCEVAEIGSAEHAASACLGLHCALRGCGCPVPFVRCLGRLFGHPRL